MTLLISAQPWGGTVAGTARGVPLPESVISPTSVGIHVQEPTASNSSKIAKSPSKSPSKASHKSKSIISEDRSTVAGAKATSRLSKAPTAKDDLRPISPMKTGVSAAQSTKSRATAQTRGTEKATNYPPLPDSVMGESKMDGPSSPRSKPHKAMSRAYSISPSDSPSQPPKPNRFQTRSHSTKHERSPSIPEGSAEPSSPKSGSRHPGQMICYFPHFTQSEDFFQLPLQCLEEALIPTKVGLFLRIDMRRPTKIYSTPHSWALQMPKLPKHLQLNNLMWTRMERLHLHNPGPSRLLPTSIPRRSKWCAMP